MSKQTVVDVIFDNFNLLSDAEFKSWMLNKYDELKAMEKEQMNSVAVDWYSECLDSYDGIRTYSSFEQYYNQKYGGEQ
jgi:hypothetical protein